MHRSVLLLLISVLVLSAASALPASLEESLEEQELKAESVENVDIIKVPNASVSSSEEQKDTAKDKADNSSASFSSDEDKQSEKAEEHSMEIAPRSRRSPEQEKYRNLELLATICPKKDFKDLEEDPLINDRIEIEDMYAVCAKLKDRHAQRRR